MFSIELITNFLRTIRLGSPLWRLFCHLLRRFHAPSLQVYQHFYFRGPFEVAVDDRRFHMIHHGGPIENSLFWGGVKKSWEPLSLPLWIELCKTSNVILDIGANTGTYSLVAKAINPQAKIYAFEPASMVFKKLVQNVKLNAYDIECIQKAVSSHNGKAKFYDFQHDHSDIASLNDKYFESKSSRIVTDIEVITLNTFIQEHRFDRIDLMKIDVETYEPQVLEGMDSYLSEFKPNILIEVLSADAGAKIEALLAGKGYLFFDIDEHNKPLRAEHLTKSSTLNYLALQPKSFSTSVASLLDIKAS